MSSTHPIAEIFPAWLAAADPLIAIPFALFLFGLVGGFAHCTAMCGPFVLVQVGSSLTDRSLGDFGILGRLRSGVLPYYHLGRATTYGALGSAAASVNGLISSVVNDHWILVVGLGLAAFIFALVAFGGWRPKGGRLAEWVARALGPLSKHRATVPMSYAIGLLLGLLPCHLVYAALAASTVLSDPLGGAAAMAAFATGTSVGLVCIGSFGAVAGHRFRTAARRLLPVAGVANVLLLTGIAARLVSGAWLG